ncbi:hypothetical protein NUU61_003942 [Penicillium alfredii]|uniref:Uncharacterized protein n=1 Tax=Penicillium alfredii TaxID=1506179 RepID=A0A9W9FKD0_9EURO|nr:uncharacterized protein NUU61_003942 [Penicillium alfredii]KAJ5101720.1 hypothetical protein NUU61_003942 [Penicillium alfredii]
MPTEVVAPIVVMIETMAALSPTECVDCKKIAMNGYLVLDHSAGSISSRQNSMEISMSKPRDPLMRKLSMMERGKILQDTDL